MATEAIADHAWKITALIAFAAWLLVIGTHHESWIDESQAWLLARDSNLTQLLIERVRYEGTPGLWHLLLWLCIRCGLPFTGLFLVSTACALAGAALLLWRSPFPPPLRILLTASYFGGYQFAIVARSYALDLVLLPVLAILFQERTERPIAYGTALGLLANSNAHSFLVAGVLGAEWLVALIRTRKLRPGFAGLSVAISLGLCALLVAWQPTDNGFLTAERLPPIAVGLRFINEAFVDRINLLSARSPSPLEQKLGLMLSLLLLAPSFILFRRAMVTVLLAATAIVLIVFSGLTYANAWHSGILFLVWIFGLWIAWPALKDSKMLKHAAITALTVIGTAQAIEAARSGIWDIRHSYSGSAQAAPALAAWRVAHPGARIAVAGFKALAVQPYYSTNIFANYQRGAPEPSYIVWKRGETWQPSNALLEAHKAMADGYDALLMSACAISPSDFADLEQTFRKDGYRATAVYSGNMEWKGYAREDDTLIFFTRQS
jgi:hypothetical protein